MKGAHTENGKPGRVETRAYECKDTERKGCSTVNLFTLVQVRLLTIYSPECSQLHLQAEGTENLNQASIIPSGPSESYLSSKNG